VREGREVVLITGASSGIGLELARQFAKYGSDLVLVARRENRLKALAEELNQSYGTVCVEYCTDLSDIDASTKVFAFCKKQNIHIDVLVNNAGFGANDAFVHLPAELQVRMLNVNIIALTHLTRLFLPDMLKKGRGGVLNIASTGAFQPGPFIAVYYASKAYVLSFTSALANEVMGTGLIVSCLAPGPVDTEFRSVAKIPPDSVLRKVAEKSAFDVARIGYKGFRSGKTLIIPGLMNRIGVFVLRFLGRNWAANMARSVNKKDNEFA
jgi:uncharacterized protein